MTCKFVIVGALSRYEGFGQFIASSRSFWESSADVEGIETLDGRIEKFQEALPKTYHASLQRMFFPWRLGQRAVYVGVQSMRAFTSFPERNRFYDRREYFYLPLHDNISPVRIATSLPQMVSFDQKRHEEPDWSLLPGGSPRPLNQKLARCFIQALLEGRPLALRIEDLGDETVPEGILGLLDSLHPAIRKYVGFGFNLPFDSVFPVDHLHAYSTLDTQAPTIKELSGTEGEDVSELTSQVYSGNLPFDDTEIRLLGLEAGKDALSRQLQWIRLHLDIAHDLSSTKPTVAVQKELRLQAELYLKTFLKDEFVSNPYLRQRLWDIYSWLGKEVSAQLFVEFWYVMGRTDSPIPPEIQAKFSRDVKTLQAAFRGKRKRLADLHEVFGSLSGVPSPLRSTRDILQEIKHQFLQDVLADPDPLDPGQALEYVEAGADPVAFFAKADFAKTQVLSLKERLRLLSGYRSQLPAKVVTALSKQIGLEGLQRLADREDFWKDGVLLKSLEETLRFRNNLEDVLIWWERCHDRGEIAGRLGKLALQQLRPKVKNLGYLKVTMGAHSHWVVAYKSEFGQLLGESLSETLTDETQNMVLLLLESRSLLGEEAFLERGSDLRKRLESYRVEDRAFSRKLSDLRDVLKRRNDPNLDLIDTMLNSKKPTPRPRPDVAEKSRSRILMRALTFRIGIGFSIAIPLGLMGYFYFREQALGDKVEDQEIQIRTQSDKIESQHLEIIKLKDDIRRLGIQSIARDSARKKDSVLSGRRRRH
jgi:hypothetical protein